MHTVKSFTVGLLNSNQLIKTLLELINYLKKILTDLFNITSMIRNCNNICI